MTRSYYVICDKIEMGQMASIFFNRFGTILFYLCFAVYLYGDLSIYGAAVAKSLADVACTYLPKNFTCNDTIPDTELCWEGPAFDRLDAYRIFLVCYLICKISPFLNIRISYTRISCRFQFCKIKASKCHDSNHCTISIFRPCLYYHSVHLYFSMSKRLNIFNY